MNKKLLMPIGFAALCTFMYPPGLSSNEKISPETSRRILDKIRRPFLKFYEKYKGVESTRTAWIKEYNPKTGKLIGTIELKTFRRDFFYREPEIKVLRVVKNGSAIPPDKYKPYQTKPAYPVLDKNGHRHYRLKVTALKKVGGRQCYEVSVTPLKQTSLHITGVFYFERATLKLIKLRFGLAKHPVGLKEMLMILYCKNIAGWPVVKRGYIKARIHLFLLQPDRIYKTSFRSTGIRLIRR